MGNCPPNFWTPIYQVTQPPFSPYLVLAHPLLSCFRGPCSLVASIEIIAYLHLFLFQDELKIGDDEFEDLQSLFVLFDLDKDGILNFKEYEKLLRCLGYRLTGK